MKEEKEREREKESERRAFVLSYSPPKVLSHCFVVDVSVRVCARVCHAVRLNAKGLPAAQGEGRSTRQWCGKGKNKARISGPVYEDDDDDEDDGDAGDTHTHIQKDSPSLSPPFGGLLPIGYR